MSANLNESIVEDAALTWFGEMRYAVGHGPQLPPGETAAERDSFGEVAQSRFPRTLTRPLPASPAGEKNREAIRRLNVAIPEEARAVVSILENTAAICEWSTP